jgi:hypothetical protein
MGPTALNVRPRHPKAADLSTTHKEAQDQDKVELPYISGQVVANTDQQEQDARKTLWGCTYPSPYSQLVPAWDTSG